MKRLVDQNKLNRIKDDVISKTNAKGPIDGSVDESMLRNKIVSIIQMGAPIPGLSITFMKDQPEWEKLTKDNESKEWWTPIAIKLGLFDVDDLNMAKIYHIMGFNWVWEVITTKNLLNRDEETLFNGVKSGLLTYLNYYDTEVCIPFMFIYMNFLQHNNGLIAFNQTMRHVAKPSPIQPTVITPPPVVSPNPFPIFTVPVPVPKPVINRSSSPEPVLPFQPKPVVKNNTNDQPPILPMFRPVVKKNDDTVKTKPAVSNNGFFKIPEKQTPPVVPQKVVEKSVPSTDPEPSLAISSGGVEYDFMTTLFYRTKESSFSYKFYTKKDAGQKLYISFDGREFSVDTKGPITKVYKFVYHSFIILIVSGDQDKKYIRFHYDLKPERFFVIDNYTLEGEWEDITYAEKESPVRFVTPRNAMKRVLQNNNYTFTALDLLLLAELKPLKSERNSMKEYRKQSTEEARRNAVSEYDRDEQTRKAGLLTEEEVEALISYISDENIRNDADGKVWSQYTPEEQEERKQVFLANTSLKDLPDDAQAAIKRGILYIEFAPEGQTKHDNVFASIVLPFTFGYVKYGQSKYQFNEWELVDLKIITVPEERREDHFHLALLTRVYNFVEKGGNLRFDLYANFAHYEKDGEGDWWPEHLGYTRANLEAQDSDANPPRQRQELMNRNGTHSVKEFNIIFHNAAWCHVEIMQVSETKTIDVMNSRIFNFDRTYAKENKLLLKDFNTGPSLPIKDKTFFELMARNHYKVFDYRRHVRANKLFQCIFVKYYPDHPQRIRIVLYREQPGNDTPSIALVRISPKVLETSVIDLISPLHTLENLFFFSFESGGKPTPLFKVKLAEKKDFVNYAQSMNLSSAIKTSLFISAPFSKEGDSMCVEEAATKHCVLCGDAEDGLAFKDTLTGNIYCEETCQYIFCKTRAM